MSPTARRSILLLGAALALAGLVLVGARIAGRPDADREAFRERPSVTGGPDAAVEYTCPMHPSVRQAAPGRCPLCGMDLAAVHRPGEGAGDDGLVELDEGRRRRAGVRTARVGREALVREVRAFGRVVFDETRLYEVSVKVGGWITHLQAAETGGPVRAGQVLFTLYSPELYAAQQEYLLARRRRTGGAAEEARGSGDALLAATRRRLALWDVAPTVLQALDRSAAPLVNVPVHSPVDGFVVEKNVVAGAAVAAGERLYRIAALDAVWIEADVYRDDVIRVAAGQPAAITLPYLPGGPLSGRVAYVYPTQDPESRTSRIRIALPNADLALRPGMLADVSLTVPLGERLAVPAAAVLYTGPRRLVFVDLGAGQLAPREVRLGARAGDHYEVLSGLVDGDVVVTSGNFLVAAESRLRAATALWGGDHAGH